MSRVDIKKIIMTSVRHFGSTRAASLDNIERHLSSTSNNIPDLENFSLNRFIDVGRNRSWLTEKRKIARFVTEEVTQNANRNAGLDPGNTEALAVIDIEKAIEKVLSDLLNNISDLDFYLTEADVSLDDIDRHLSNILKSTSDLEISPSLNNTMEHGFLSKQANRREKIKETPEVAQDANLNPGTDPGNAQILTAVRMREVFMTAVRDLSGFKDIYLDDMERTFSETINNVYDFYFHLTAAGLSLNDIEQLLRDIVNNISVWKGKMEETASRADAVIQDPNLNAGADPGNEHISTMLGITKVIMTAVRYLCGSNSLRSGNIERLLSNVLKNISDLEISLSQNNAVDHGLVSKHTNERDNIKKTARCAEVVQNVNLNIDLDPGNVGVQNASISGESQDDQNNSD